MKIKQNMNNLKEIKNKTLLRLAELKNQKEQVSKELVIWKAKEQKAQEFLKVLYEIGRFAYDYLTDKIAKEREKVKQNLLEDPDEIWPTFSLEIKTENKEKFKTYSQGLELFEKLTVKDIQYQTQEIETKLASIDNEIEKLENKLDKK